MIPLLGVELPKRILTLINLFTKPRLVLLKVFTLHFFGFLAICNSTVAYTQESEGVFNQLIQGGRFTVGSSYGAVNGLPLQTDPHTILYTEGSLNVMVKRLPFKANYYISNSSEIGGRRNSFTFQFDSPKLSQMRANRIAELKQKLSINIDSLLYRRHELGSRIAYYQFSDQFYHVPDSLNIPALSLPDSLGEIPSQPHLPSIPEDLPSDSLNQWLEDYKKVSLTIEEYKKYKSEWDNLQKTPKVELPAWKEAFRLQNVRSFQIGAASPDYSALTVQGNRIIGLAITTETESLHLDAAIGFLRTSYAQGTSRPSLLDQIIPMDIFSAPAGRLIATRIGYGQQNASHIYLGYTGGRNQIMDDLFSGTTRQRRSNVFDISGRLAKGVHTVDVTLAQRLNTGNSTPSESGVSSPVSRWFHSALHADHSSEFTKIATRLETKAMWIGPGYFSVGAPFLLSDNARIETKLSNQSFRYFQPALSLKHQFNDVLDQYDYQNRISIGGLEVSSRIFQSWIVRLFVGPAISHITNGDINIISKNYVYQLGSTFMRQTKNFTYNLQISAGRNLQMWDTLILNSDQANIVFGISTKSGFISSISIIQNRFVQNDVELINFSMLDWQCTLPLGKRILLSSGISLLRESQVDMGAFGQLRFKLGKNFEWSIEGRRFVWPSFNTDFAPLTGIRIPYLLNTSLQYILK